MPIECHPHPASPVKGEGLERTVSGWILRVLAGDTRQVALPGGSYPSWGAARPAAILERFALAGDGTRG
jgi:hypothetical protein